MNVLSLRWSPVRKRQFYIILFCSFIFVFIIFFFVVFVQMLLLQGNNYGGGGSSNTYGQPSSTAGHMYEEDIISRGARAFPLGHGMVPTPQAFSFGFPVHPAHDPMGLSSCKSNMPFSTFEPRHEISNNVAF